jgi:carboxymethylenebutenolidase
MGKTVELTASDGHHPSAYLAEPNGKPRGAIVVVQEIFGVTHHMRAVVDQYAAAGFTSIAPALFDRVEPNVDVPYTNSVHAFAYVQKLTDDQVLRDLQAAIDAVASAGKVGMVGYCWGGAMTYLAAARLKLAAAIAYYGGGIQAYLDEKPRCPVMFHYGELDTHIPLATVELVKEAVPEGHFFLYPAGHGFNCADRASFDGTCAKLALDRSLEFLHRYVG